MSGLGSFGAMQFGTLLESGRGWFSRRGTADDRIDPRTVFQPLRIQGRVILALMLREARTRYGRHRAGYLWALVEPILHILFFYFLWHFTLRVVPLGHSLALFLATGLATYCGFSNVLNRTQGGFASNEALLAYPIVTVADVFLARAFLELSTWVAVSFIILGSLILFASDPLPHSVPTLILAMLLLFGVALGVGTILGIVSQFFPSVDTLLTIPLKLLYFTSGVFYLPEALPPAARDVLAWNPVLHGITLFRIGYYGNYDSHLLSFGYLIGWCVVSMLLAFLLERVLRKALLSRSY